MMDLYYGATPTVNQVYVSLQGIVMPTQEPVPLR